MSVSAVSASIPPTSTSTAATSTAGRDTVSATQFISLLSAQMANQDPTQPMDPNTVMTQLAQISNLQMTTAISQNSSLQTANSYLGLTVAMPAKAGNPPVTGVVTSIDSSAVAGGGAPLLVVTPSNGGTAVSFPVTAVGTVTLPAPSASTGSTGAAAAAASGTQSVTSAAIQAAYSSL